MPASDTTDESTTILSTTIPTTTILSTTIPTTTIIVSTTTNVNVIVGTTEISLGYEQSDIIIMCTVIPVLWIAVLIAYFYIRRSRDVIGGILHPFNNISREGKTWDSYELTDVSDV